MPDQSDLSSSALFINYMAWYRTISNASRRKPFHASLNPFLPVDASAADDFWKLCDKTKIAQNEQFFLLPQCIQLIIVI